MRLLRCLLVAAALLVLTCPQAMTADQPIVLKVGTMLDGKGGVVQNTTIVVQGLKIARIDPKAQGVTYDLTGLTVMPGWIDTHVHVEAFSLHGR